MSPGEVVTSKPSGDYALDKIQNPELLEVAYRAIQDGSQSESELKDALAIDDDTIDLITKGFRIFGLGGKSGFKYDLAPLKYTHGSGRTRFRLHILNSVASSAKPDDWGMQSAVLLNLEYLLKEDTYRFVQTDEALIRNIDDWHQEVGYEPQSSNGRRKLNKPKFSHWTNQAEYLGLLHHYKDGRKSAFVVRFDPELVQQTVRIACDEIGDGDGIIFDKYLGWLQRNFIRIPTTGENAVPKPFARVLYTLVRDGRLRITKNGDPATVGLPGIPKHDNIASSSNYLKT